LAPSRCGEHYAEDHMTVESRSWQTGRSSSLILPFFNAPLPYLVCATKRQGEIKCGKILFSKAQREYGNLSAE